MALYAIIAPPDSVAREALEEAIKNEFPGNFYKFADGQLMIAVEKLTSGQVMEKLKLSEGNLGRALILQVGAYSGWHSTALWEWMRNQINPSPAPTPSPPEDPKVSE